MSNSPTETITEIVARRQIQEVVHFTTNLGFLGCLARGAILPRRQLAKDQLLEHILTLNAPFRTEEEPWFDQSQAWIEYVNLSISEITANLFKHSLKWHAGKDIFWLILSFSPALMEDPGVFFATTNNIYPLAKRQAGAVGLEALFAPLVPRKRTWTATRGSRPPHLPTCEQAEVLYPNGLSMSYLRKVYVREGDDQDRVYSMLSAYSRGSIEIEINREKFSGKPN